MSKPADEANTGNGKLSIEFLLHYPLEMKKLYLFENRKE